MSGAAAIGAYRSFLYVPADNERMLAKAAERGADALILDLEDAVAPARKDDARAAALRWAAEHGAELPVWVRANDGVLGAVDVEALAGAPGVAGVWLAKAEPGPELSEWVGRLRAAGTRVGIMIESAQALARIADFPVLPPDTLVQIGEADLSADLGIAGRGDQLAVYRSMVVLECAARGLPAPVGPVSVDVTDLDGFRIGSAALRERGFFGRACVHPAQVEIANDVWRVGPEDVARARALLEEFARQEADGRGAYRAADGTMVDRATVRWAETVMKSSR